MGRHADIEREMVVRKALNLFFILFLIIGALLAGMVGVFYRAEVLTHENTLKTQEQYSVALQSAVTSEVFETIVSDLLFLAGQNELRAFLESGSATDRAAMAREYLQMAERKRIYDQIRFLDETGKEVTRVNFNQGFPEIVPKDRLQNKAGRYYFTDCFALGVSEIFISPLDLNVEHGQVEQPHKPMVRIGTPVFDAQGRKRGIVLVNYLGKYLLDRIKKAGAVSKGDPMLLNAEGYWLLSPDSDDQWSFMFEDRTEKSFANRFPEVWSQILKKRNGQILTRKGLFTYDSIYPLLEGIKSSTGSGEAYTPSAGQLERDEYFWVLVSHVPSKIMENYSRSLLVKLFLLGAGLFMVIATGAWFLALAITRRKIYQAQLTAMAHYDMLTDLPNRTLFFDRLNQTLHASSRYRRAFALLYVDLDGFKQVNDTLGHKAGDDLLVDVAERLLSCCRKTDTVGRLGGDEFAILLTEVGDLHGVTLVAEKILESLAEPIPVTGGEAKVGASIGVSIYPENGEGADLLLHRADEAMYVSKKRGKNTFTLWKPEYTGAANSGK